MGTDFVPTGVQTGLSGSICAAQVITSILAAGNSVIAPGLYLFYAVGANITLQVQDSAGAWNNVTAIGVGGMVCSDGTNMRFNNAGAGTQTVTSVKIG